MPNHIDDLLVLDGAFEPDLQSADVGGGTMVAYTSRAPDKDTENEDTVAIIPWAPDSAVLVVADGAGGLPAGKRASETAVLTLAGCLGAGRRRGGNRIRRAGLRGRRAVASGKAAATPGPGTV